jgi:hypothetical protein
MKDYILQYRDGSHDVKRNVFQALPAHDGLHYFSADTDAAMYRVTVVGLDGFVKRHYSTQDQFKTDCAGPRSAARLPV